MSKSIILSAKVALALMVFGVSGMVELRSWMAVRPNHRGRCPLEASRR